MTNVCVDFFYPNGETVWRLCSIKHLRNQELNENGGVIDSPNGGYTVIADQLGNMVVATCNYRSDRFSRKKGLMEAFRKYAKYKMCQGYVPSKIVCRPDNKIEITLVKE